MVGTRSRVLLQLRPQEEYAACRKSGLEDRAMLRPFRKSVRVEPGPDGKPSNATSPKCDLPDSQNRAKLSSRFTFATIALLICVAVALIASLAPRDTIAWGAGAQR